MRVVGRGFAVVFVAALWLGACDVGSEQAPRAGYCGGETPPSSGTECRKNEDCGMGLVCAAPRRDSGGSGLSPQRVAPPLCTVPTCAADAECGPGTICEVPTLLAPAGSGCYLGKYCVERCRCETTERCRTDGHCEVIPCDAPESLGCPAGWRCAPGVGDPAVNATPEARRGCVRVPCNLPGGIACQPDWTCDPARAPNLSSAPPWGSTAGCAAVPCGSGYTCEGSLVCYPNGASTAISGGFPMGVREDGRWVDVHGCVQPNCKESAQACLDHTECAVGDSRSDPFGCRNVSCAEPGGPDCEALTSGAEWCNPAASSQNQSYFGRLGCAAKWCSQGYPCAAGTFCDFENPAHDLVGCVPERCRLDPASCVPTGGTGGAPPGAGGRLGASGGASGGASPGASGGAATSGGAGGALPPRAPLDGACTVDADCSCGSCVLGICAARPGLCVAP